MNHEDAPIDDHAHTLPGISVVPSITLFSNNTSRNRSLSKTFSHPGLVHAHEAEGTPQSKEPGGLLTARKPSITRVSSCPPAIRAGSEGSEPTERQQEERYVPCPTADVKMPRSLLANAQESRVIRTGGELPATVDSEELIDSDTSSNDDSSTEDGGAEAMAMRSLAIHFPSSLHQSSVPSVSHVKETQLEMISVSSNAGIFQGDEEGTERLSECGSSTYIKLESTASTASKDTESSQPVHREEQPEKLRAGSYVTLSTAMQGSRPQSETRDSNILQKSSTVHSTVEDPLESPVSNAAETRSSAIQNAGHQTPRITEVSSYQTRPAVKETSHNFKSPDELLASLSRDNSQEGVGSVALKELLPDIDDDSFEEGSSPLITDLQEESESDHTDFRGFAELSLGQFSHPVSNVGLELNEISEQPSAPANKHNHHSSQPRADMDPDSAKASTGNSNKQELREHHWQEDSTLPNDGQFSLGKCSSQTSNIGLEELSNLSEQPFSFLEEEHCHYSLEPRADVKLDSAEGSPGYISNSRPCADMDSGDWSASYISNQKLNQHNRQGDRPLSDESQLSLDKFPLSLSSVGLGLTEMIEESSTVVQEEPSRDSSQLHMEQDSANVSTGYISHEELHERSIQEDSTLPEDSQDVDSFQDLDPFKFCRNASISHTSSVTEQICNLLPELDNTANEESDQENEDAAETSDTELSSLGGPVGYSRGNVEVLNSPFLVFDQGQEKLEMKEFSLNNLSKENLKSTEFLVFEDDHFLQEINFQCSNQLDDTLSEDGVSLHGDQEAECGIQGNIWEDPGNKEMSDLKGKS